MADKMLATIEKLEKVVKEMAALPPILRVAIGRKKKGALEVTSERTTLLAPEVINVIRPAVVKTGVGLTISLGNYEFARVDAGIEWPCDPENVGDTFKKAWEVVEAELKKEAAEVKGASSKKE